MDHEAPEASGRGRNVRERKDSSRRSGKETEAEGAEVDVRTGGVRAAT
jgi:hypothetical protein